MPSTLMGSVSGVAQPLVSGCYWSGMNPYPVGGIQLRLDPAASGNVYVGLSGNVTLSSGSTFLSGGGVSDGFQMAPGDGYFIPRSALRTSGEVNIYFRYDAACSGQARMFYEFM